MARFTSEAHAMNTRFLSLFHSGAFFAAGWFALLVFCVPESPLCAQTAGPDASAAVQPASAKLNPEELGQLLSPIALYPDALIALILPASTVPSDVVLGARYLKANGDPDRVENQPWDESVKALTRYPDVLGWMDQNLEWTASVGEAFVEQPADVMNAIQSLREQAKAAGNLQDTPEQRIVVDENAIRIVPADPQVIFVPQYDPRVVYVQSYSSVPVLTFGVGFAVGSWLDYDFDWNRRCIYHGHWRGWDHDWHNNWSHGPNGNRDRNESRANVVNIDVNTANQWQPGEDSRRQVTQRQHNNNGNARYMNVHSNDQVAVPQNVLPRPSRLERSGEGSVPVHGPVPVRSGNSLETPNPPPNRHTGTVLPGTPVDARNSTRSNMPPAPKTETGNTSAIPKTNRSNPSPSLSASNPIRVPTPPQVVEPANTPLRVETTPPRHYESPASMPVNPPQSGKVRIPSIPPPQVSPPVEQRQPRLPDTSSNNFRKPEVHVETSRPPVQRAPVAEPQRPQIQANPVPQQQPRQTSENRIIPPQQTLKTPVVNPQAPSSQSLVRPQTQTVPAQSGASHQGGKKKPDEKKAEQ